jgi:predicted AAA+ superfamily ATPase
MIYGMIIQRDNYQTALRSALSRAPAVALLGARQVGKTTLAKQLASTMPGSVYLDLEKKSDWRKLEDPGIYLRAQTGHLTIIDEIHRMPTLFAELRSIIDERRETGERYGQFLLLGSASLDLVQNSSETLAGRMAYLELPPIGLTEAALAGRSVEQLWLRGGFPDSLIASRDADSFYWRQDFIRSYLERDIPLFAPKLPRALIGRLWTMMANGQGTLLNSARLAQGLGITAPTVSRYIDLLDDLLLLRRLQPWSGNLDKRLVRSPKIYVRDSGLVHALAEIGTLDHLLGHPLVGPSWEGFLIENLITAAGKECTPMFYRTADGAEIDLIIERGGIPLMGFEIKRSSAPKVEHGFCIACDDLKLEHRFIVAPVNEAYPIKGGSIVLSPLEAIERVRQLTTLKFQ